MPWFISYHLWIKSFHIIFVVTWFAGLFYLPRLFVYHAMATDAISLARFKIMERKLLWGIMTPAAVLTLITAHWLILYNPTHYLTATWLQLKLVLVTILVIFHGFCAKFCLDFKKDRNSHGHIFYRWFNEVPTVLLLAIVILAVVKPFHTSAISIISKSSFPAPHSGQRQVIGMSAQSVPAGMPSSGQPFASS